MIQLLQKSVQKLYVFPAICNTETYKKTNGMCACGFYLENQLSWREAADKCHDLGARLPEIYSYEENIDIMNLKVSS
jgi:hypothetical protein